MEKWALPAAATIAGSAAAGTMYHLGKYLRKLFAQNGEPPSSESSATQPTSLPLSPTLPTSPTSPENPDARNKVSIRFTKPFSEIIPLCPLESKAHTHSSAAEDPHPCLQADQTHTRHSAEDQADAQTSQHAGQTACACPDSNRLGPVACFTITGLKEGESPKDIIQGYVGVIPFLGPYKAGKTTWIHYFLGFPIEECIQNVTTNTKGIDIYQLSKESYFLDCEGFFQPLPNADPHFLSDFVLQVTVPTAKCIVLVVDRVKLEELRLLDRIRQMIGNREGVTVLMLHNIPLICTREQLLVQQTQLLQGLEGVKRGPMDGILKEEKSNLVVHAIVGNLHSRHQWGGTGGEGQNDILKYIKDTYFKPASGNTVKRDFEDILTASLTKVASKYYEPCRGVVADADVSNSKSTSAVESSSRDADAEDSCCIDSESNRRESALHGEAPPAYTTQSEETPHSATRGVCTDQPPAIQSGARSADEEHEISIAFEENDIFVGKPKWLASPLSTGEKVWSYILPPFKSYMRTTMDLRNYNIDFQMKIAYLPDILKVPDARGFNRKEIIRMVITCPGFGISDLKFFRSNSILITGYQKIYGRHHHIRIRELSNCPVPIIMTRGKVQYYLDTRTYDGLGGVCINLEPSQDLNTDGDREGVYGQSASAGAWGALDHRIGESMELICKYPAEHNTADESKILEGLAEKTPNGCRCLHCTNRSKSQTLNRKR